MQPKNFIRRVGFGIRPDEPNPTEPLNWALEQFDHPSNLIWPGRIYSQSEMLDIRIDFVDSEDAIQSSTKTPLRRERNVTHFITGPDAVFLSLTRSPSVIIKQSTVRRPFLKDFGISGETISQL